MSVTEKGEIIFEVLGKVDNIYRAQYREAAALLDDLIKELEQYKAVVDAAKVFDEVVAWEAQGNSDWPEMAGLHEALSNLKEKG